MELDELSAELGYDGYLDAMADGYDWATNKDGSAYLYKIDMKGEMEKAHDEWVKERDELLEQIEACINLDQKGWGNIQDTLIKARDFIKRGEV